MPLTKPLSASKYNSSSAAPGAKPEHDALEMIDEFSNEDQLEAMEQMAVCVVATLKKLQPQIDLMASETCVAGPEFKIAALGPEAASDMSEAIMQKALDEGATHAGAQEIVRLERVRKLRATLAKSRAARAL